MASITQHHASDTTVKLVSEALLEWAIVTIGTELYTNREAQANYLLSCIQANEILYPIDWRNR